MKRSERMDKSRHKYLRKYMITLFLCMAFLLCIGTEGCFRKDNYDPGQVTGAVTNVPDSNYPGSGAGDKREDAGRDDPDGENAVTGIPGNRGSEEGAADTAENEMPVHLKAEPIPEIPDGGWQTEAVFPDFTSIGITPPSLSIKNSNS